MVFLMVGLSMIVAPEVKDNATRALGLALTIGGATLTIRSLRMASITLDGKRVLVRTIWWTYRFPVATVVRFKIVERMGGLGSRGRALAAERADGRVKVFGEFFAYGHGDHGASQWIERLVADLNRHLAAVNGSDDSDG
jgi:hypothetical protein